MLRTTVALDEKVHKKARIEAINKRVSFGEEINNALADHYGLKMEEKEEVAGLKFLKKLIEISEKYQLDGPKDVAKNHDKYLPDNFKK